MNPTILALAFFAGVALLVWQAVASALNARHQRKADERWIENFIARANADRAKRDRWGRYTSADARQHNLDAVAETHTEGRTREPRRQNFHD